MKEKIDQVILNDIRNKLHPKLSTLLLKIFSLHLIAAIISLSLCPQFGFRLFDLNFNLMNSFMIFGMSFCQLMCGAFFSLMSVTFILTGLNRDERRYIKYHQHILASVILLTSIGFFAIMKIDLFLEFSLFWILGGTLSIYLTMAIIKIKDHLSMNVSRNQE
jgi:hypothetical protein